MVADALAPGQGADERAIAESTGYTRAWIGQIAKRYNEQGPDGMHNRRHTTSWRAPRMLSAEQQEELRQALAGPAPDGAKYWRARAVADWMAATLGRPVATQRGWDYLQRLKHEPASAAAASCAGRSGTARHLQKKLRPLVQAVATALPDAHVEVWATDEHRIGLKPLCVASGRRLVSGRPPWCSTASPGATSSALCIPPPDARFFHLATTVSIPVFEVELAEFARQVGAGPAKQIVLVLDRAGWHTSLKLRVPDHVHLLFLPPYSPELQPAEHLWPLTNAALVNQHFATIEDLEDAQFARCAVLQRQRERIRSTTLFHWWPKQIHKRRGPRRN